MLAVVALVVACLFAVDHLARMDARFFGFSLAAARALAHYFAGDYGGAARWYREALRRDTLRSSPALSWSLLARGEREQAAVQARMESAAAPADPEPLLTLAEIALARRDPAAALAHAGQALERRRDDYDALLITAVAHARQGAHHSAIDALGRALRHDRVERRVTVFLAVLEATGELDDRPADRRPSGLLAHLHRYLRIYDPSQARAASRYAQRALEVRDHPDDAYVTLAVVHAAQGRPTRALAAFRQALAVNPRNTAALLGAARLRADRGEIDEEYRLLRAAFESDGDDRFIVARFHTLLVDKLGDYGQALAFAEAAVTAHAGDGEAWWRRGHVHTQLGDHHEALHSYRRAAALMPRTAELHDHIGRTLADLGRDEEAFAAYGQAVALDPHRPQPHLGLAVLHGKSRRWTEAIQELETVARLGGGVTASLCELYFEAGRLAAATLCATAVLTQDPDNVQMLALMEHVRGAVTASITR
ncbi:MAG TPA: tetratricopeptide repeat protein [Candidatus Limnocylindria bacterium]|nr:tetratricopeptide repeat protein [Candidatus Limnocylindria bacterium]